MFSVPTQSKVRREYPNWNQRGRIKKVESGNIVEGQFAFNNEVVRVSPRYGRLLCKPDTSWIRKREL